MAQNMCEPGQEPPDKGVITIAPDRPLVPNWAVIGIFLILLFFFIADARGFLMPVTMAILLFFVFIPFRRMMDRLGISASITAAIVTLGLVVSVVAIGFIISGPIERLVENAPAVSTRLEQRFNEIRSNFKGLERAAAKLDELSHGSGPSVPAPPVDSPPALTGTITTPGGPGASASVEQPIRVQMQPAPSGSALGSVLALGPEIAGQIILTLFMLFFLLASGDLLYLKIVQSFDSMRDKRTAYTAMREIEDSLGTYLGTITLINACLGVVLGLAMWVWGMPNAFLFGLGGFLLNYIPYLGPVAGVVITFVVALLILPDIWTPLVIAGTFWAICAIEGQLITPFFVSRKLQLNTVVVFLTVALWAWLWSVLGMVVAVPLLVVLRVLASHIPGLQKFGNFLAGEDPPAIPNDDPQDESAAP